MPNFAKDELCELEQIIKIADTYGLVNPATAENLLEKIEEMEEEYE